MHREEGYSLDGFGCDSDALGEALPSTLKVNYAS